MKQKSMHVVYLQLCIISYRDPLYNLNISSLRINASVGYIKRKN